MTDAHHGSQIPIISKAVLPIGVPERTLRLHTATQHAEVNHYLSYTYWVSRSALRW
jgi:hypothetical protein